MFSLALDKQELAKLLSFKKVFPHYNFTQHMFCIRFK